MDTKKDTILVEKNNNETRVWSGQLMFFCRDDVYFDSGVSGLEVSDRLNDRRGDIQELCERISNDMRELMNIISE